MSEKTNRPQLRGRNGERRGEGEQLDGGGVAAGDVLVDPAGRQSGVDAGHAVLRGADLDRSRRGRGAHLQGATRRVLPRARTRLRHPPG
jgi:hypothetical protein